jgi:hypothetical protein
MNSELPHNLEDDVQVEVGDEQINHVNTELCNLQIKENKKNKVNTH